VPELPDIVVYVERLAARVLGQPLEALRLASPFLLRTVEPPPRELEGRRVCDVLRLGKRVVIALEGELYAALHLMIAGRLHWCSRALDRGGLEVMAGGAGGGGAENGQGATGNG